MNKKVLIIALVCALASFVLNSAAFASTDAYISVTGGKLIITGHGAYSEGLYFNFKTGVEGVRPGEADLYGRNLNPATDYISIISSVGGAEWTMYVSATDFINTSKTLSFAPSTIPGDSVIKLSAPETDQNFVSQYKEIVSTSGAYCYLELDDITLNQLSSILEESQVVMNVDNNYDRMTGCVSYETKAMFPLNMHSITNGFPEGTFTGTLIFTVAENGF